MRGRKSRSSPEYSVNSEVRPQGRPTVKPIVPLSSRECRGSSVKGPVSCIALACTEIQLKNDDVDMYTNWRNKFWFIENGASVSRRTVNCTPGLKAMVLEPRRSTGLIPVLNVVSKVLRCWMSSSLGNDSVP